MNTAEAEEGKAWAIKAHIPGHKYPCLFGVFHFVDNLHDCQDGMRTALFRTRQQARNALNGMRIRLRKSHMDHPMKVVRIRFAIEEEY